MLRLLTVRRPSKSQYLLSGHAERLLFRILGSH